MTGHDPAAELGEAIINYRGCVVELGDGIDDVGAVEVDGEGLRAVHRFDEPDVGVGVTGVAPLLHLDGELRPLRLDGIDHFAAVLDRSVKELCTEVFRMGAPRDFRVIGTRVVDAAAHCGGFREGAALSDVLQGFLALGGVGIHHVDPRATSASTTFSAANAFRIDSMRRGIFEWTAGQ